MMKMRLLTVGMAGFCQAALAQDLPDRSIAKAYASQCPNDEPSAACKLLRDALAHSTVGSAKQTTLARQSEWGQLETTTPTSWGSLTGREQAWWRGKSQIWLIEKGQSQTAGTFGGLKPGGPDFYQISVYTASGDALGWKIIAFRNEKTQKLKAREAGNTWIEEPILPDGSIFFRRFRHALVGVDYNSFEWVPGTSDEAGFHRDERLSNGVSGRYVRLSNEETLAFNSRVSDRAAAVKLAEAQRKAQAGNSGMLGAVAMGFGAAMAGGNPEMVMGAAMKGAELTTDNEMTRNVLAGQGDQMMQAGFNTMAAKNAPRAEAGRQGGPAGDAETAALAKAPVNKIAAPETRTRYTYCAEGRLEHGFQDAETLFYSRVGSISRPVGEFFRDTDPHRFSQDVSLITTAPAPGPGAAAVCPQFDTSAQAEAGLAMRREHNRYQRLVESYIPQ